MFVVDDLVFNSGSSLAEVVGEGADFDEILLVEGGKAYWYFLPSRHRDNINTILSIFKCLIGIDRYFITIFHIVGENSFFFL